MPLARALSSTGAIEMLDSHKRKLTEDDEVTRSGKKSRTRVSYSCGECHRRKQKCNRQMPCSHCIARKVPELCKAYSPGKSEQDIHSRIARIEQVLELALPRYWFSSSGSSSRSGDTNGVRRQRSMSSSPDDENASDGEEQDVVGGSFQRGSWFGTSASGAIASASVLEQLNNAVSFNSGLGHDRKPINPQSGMNPAASSSSTPSFTAENSGVGTDRCVAANNLKALIHDCGVSPHKISELMQELPPKPLADGLLDYYFSSINWTRYPIPETDFRASYTLLLSSGANAHPHDVRFLPLLFVVLAISIRLSPERSGGDAKMRRLTSLRYYWSSRRSVLIAAAIQPDCLELVYTRLLSARFLTFDRRITECWSQLGAAVSTAQSLGLHRDGAAMGMDSVQVEQRRRIWAHLYHADRSFALILGRPFAIKDEYTSTQIPLNLEFDLSASTPMNNPLPLTTPTPMSFVILRHRLSSIMGGMVHHFQQVQRQSHYSEVSALDDALVKFMQDLPPYFSMNPDTSFDQTHRYIPAHRFLIITEVLFVRITLHRPYLLRRLDSDRYLPSRKACFESALKDFEVRQAFRQTVSKEAREAVAMAYREFQAVMISAIYLVLNPTGKEASVMFKILDSFLLDHECHEDMDETTSREVKTIQFLKSKALQMVKGPTNTAALSTSDSDRPSSVETDHNSIGNHPDAHLLLALQQSARQAHQDLPTSHQVSPRMRSASSSSSFQPGQDPSSFDFQSSLPTTGSPQEDESTAQLLLDRWCNVGSGTMLDGQPGIGGLSWGPVPGTNPWWISNVPLFSPNSQLWSGNLSTGSDLSYWETLVDQIRSVPS